MSTYRLRIYCVFLILIITLTACAQANSSQSSTMSTNPVTNQINSVKTPIPGNSTEIALAPETNPVGDIPDNQVFIQYSSLTGGYSIEVPEGWARSEQGTDVRFVDKFDGISVALSSASSAPTVDSVTKKEAATLAKSERAFTLGKVNIVNLQSGSVVHITATVNSDPDPVTAKQVRLEEEFFLFYQNGKQAMLKLWAPQGADNVDQWKSISESFSWK
jgi:hypothetical protein